MKEMVEFGTHRAWVEGDVMRVVEQGLVSLSEIQTLMALIKRWQKEYGIQYALLDVRRMLPFEPEVKKWLMHEFKTIRLRAVVGIGASATVRIMTSLGEQAMDLLGYKDRTMIVSLRTEAEALAWIEADRKKHRERR